MNGLFYGSNRYRFASCASPLAEALEKRRASLNRTCAGGYEVCYEGVDLPGEGDAPYYVWDNPIDDDWPYGDFRASGAFRTNQAEDGRTYLSIDRSRADWVDQPGWIMRRDQFVNHATGVDIGISVRVSVRSADYGIALLYGDEKNRFTLFFNKRSVALSTTPYPTGIVARSRSIDLTSGFVEFRIHKDAGSATVTVYRVGADRTEKVVIGPVQAGSHAPREGDFGRITGIIFGDNYDDVRGAVDLDFLRFKRAVGGTKQPAPELPRPEADASHFTIAAADLLEPRYIGKSHGRFDVPPAAFGYLAPFSIEWKMRFRSTADTEGFMMMSHAGLGATYGVAIRPEGIRSFAYAKPVSSQLVRPAGFVPTDWHCFRLVRPEGSQTAHLYMDAELAPVLMDIKGGHTGATYFRVLLGQTRCQHGMPNWPESAGMCRGRGSTRRRMSN